MKEDYLKNLKTLTNQELIEITLNPESYEIEAVKKAHEIIIERKIGIDEINEVMLSLEKNHDKRNDRTNDISSIKKKAKELFKPIVYHGEDITPKKWLNSFLFLQR